MEELFALTILRILRLKFDSKVGFNPDYIEFTNQSGQSIYVQKHNNTVEIKAFRVSACCYAVNITSELEIEDVVDMLKTKLKYRDINK